MKWEYFIVGLIVCGFGFVTWNVSVARFDYLQEVEEKTLDFCLDNGFEGVEYPNEGGTYCYRTIDSHTRQYKQIIYRSGNVYWREEAKRE